MKLEDISKEMLTTTRRVLAGGAIAAVAVFGVAACEDTAVDDPGVELEGEDGLDEGLDDGLEAPGDEGDE
ncbi:MULTISPECIES: hypothetical protein [Nocardiopsis]|uniref:Lipoprotein n=1 Tax=Nocardiopsis alba TaxID=53437 RepID=A0A7K2IXV5_9ACTN|nr:MULTISPECIES: hypothetical protein [Nocardiopsis]MEC3891970.1 hypothetical protein [Nocardiopsis sp. LDBS1602]MYR34654.1 hypothetical protein [Nocardiopsis alba]